MLYIVKNNIKKIEQIRKTLKIIYEKESDSIFYNNSLIDFFELDEAYKNMDKSIERFKIIVRLNEDEIK